MHVLVGSGAWGLLGACLGILIWAGMAALPVGTPFGRVLRYCRRCGRRRTAVELVPVIGAFLEWRRTDGRCDEAIRRLLIELGTGCAFGWLAWRHGASWLTVVLSVYCLIFGLIIGVDLEQRLILNRVLVPSAAFALLAAPSLPQVGLLPAIAGGSAGFLLLLLVAALSRGGMGAGDVKLAGFLGLVTGFPDILATLAVGIFLGGATVVILLVLRRVGPKDYVAYGPFLIAGAILRLALW